MCVVLCGGATQAFWVCCVRCVVVSLEAHAGLVRCTEEKCMRYALLFGCSLLGSASAAVCTPCTAQHTKKPAGFSVFCVCLYHTPGVHNATSVVQWLLCCAVLRWVWSRQLLSAARGKASVHCCCRICCWAGAGSRLQSHACCRCMPAGPSIASRGFPWCDLNNARTWR